jgi:hypothetical protein
MSYFIGVLALATVVFVLQGLRDISAGVDTIPSNIVGLTFFGFIIYGLILLSGTIGEIIISLV